LGADIGNLLFFGDADDVFDDGGDNGVLGDFDDIA